MLSLFYFKSTRTLGKERALRTSMATVAIIPTKT